MHSRVYNTVVRLSAPRIFKIGEHLAKLETKWLIFQAHRCSTFAAVGTTCRMQDRQVRRGTAHSRKCGQRHAVSGRRKLRSDSFTTWHRVTDSLQTCNRLRTDNDSDSRRTHTVKTTNSNATFKRQFCGGGANQAVAPKGLRSCSCQNQNLLTRNSPSCDCNFGNAQWRRLLSCLNGK